MTTEARKSVSNFVDGGHISSILIGLHRLSSVNLAVEKKHLTCYHHFSG
jgi:hypothetical protein